MPFQNDASIKNFPHFSRENKIFVFKRQMKRAQTKTLFINLKKYSSFKHFISRAFPSCMEEKKNYLTAT